MSKSSSRRHPPARSSQFKDSAPPPVAPANAAAATASGAPPATTTAPGRFAHLLGKLKHVKGAIVAIAGTGAVLSGMIGWYTTYKTVATPTASTPATQAAKPINSKSIAVLPFANMSGDKGQEYFSDGISEELLNQLTKVRDLQVMARTSSFSFKGKDVEVSEIARRLHVANILQGSIRKSGTKVRITAQLIRAADSSQIWSETYDRDMNDIFAVQDEISAAVVEQLKARLLGGAPKATAADPEAYALMLQARQLRRQSTRDSLQNAVALLQQALKLDPRYAEGWAELATVYLNQAGNQTRQPKEAYAQSRDAINKALAINPNLARAHDHLGWIAMIYDRDLAQAAQHYQRALALAPNDVAVIANTTALLNSLNRLDSAIATSEWAARQNPVSAVTRSNLGNFYQSAKRYDEAIATYQAALRLSPGYIGAQGSLALTLLLKGDAQAARAEALKEADELNRLSALGLIEHALGAAKASDAAVAELAKKFPVDATLGIAEIHAYRGEADAAFAWLAKAVAANLDVSSLPTDPFMDKLKQDPRWLPFMRKLGKAPEQLAAIKFEVPLPTAQ